MNDEKMDPFDLKNHKEHLQLKRRMESGEILHQMTLRQMEKHADDCPICLKEALKKTKKN